MKELSEFKNWLKKIAEKNIEDEKLKFVWTIMKSPFVEFHYDLLKDKNLDAEFRGDLAFRFNEHGEEAEDLLISKLDNNQDIEISGRHHFLVGKIE